MRLIPHREAYSGFRCEFPLSQHYGQGNALWQRDGRTAQAAKKLIPRLYSKRGFGFAEVDIEVPRDLWEEFEEFLPIFINQSVGVEGVPQHMKDYLAKSGRVATPDQKKLLGVRKARKVLLYAPLLKWYHEPVSNHGRSSHDRLHAPKNLQLVCARSSQHAKER